MKLLTTFVLTFSVVGALFSQEPERNIHAKSLKNSTKPKAEVKNTSSVMELAPIDKKEEQSHYPMKVNSGEHRKKVQNNSAPRSRTIDDINTEIESIVKKMDYVRNNPTEDAIAKKEGWYNKMNDRLTYLNAERQKHLNKK